MSRPITIEALRLHLDHAKTRLTREKAAILTALPLPLEFSREEYAFAYVRAERMGMKAINDELSEISWLPMQLDPSSEVLVEGRNAMKKWLNADTATQPDSDIFGNDFMHALTRSGMLQGWEAPEFGKLSRRIGHLFRDLSCLIGVIYYCTWLTEHGVMEIRLSKPEDIRRTAEEIAILLQSPEIFQQLKAPEQDDRNNPTESKVVYRGKEERRKSPRPNLHIISDNGVIIPHAPETVF